MSKLIFMQKRSQDIQTWIRQLKTLDLNCYGSWPFSIQWICWILIFILVMILGYVIVICPQIDAIEQAQSQRQQHLKALREQKNQIQQLQQYQAQLQDMETLFQQQLVQLPQQTELPQLVDDMSHIAQQVGLKLKQIGLEPEIKQALLIEQPIHIEATGDYHAFGAFSSGIAALSRIVTLHDFTIEVQTPTRTNADLPNIAYVVTAKTYRYHNTDASSQRVRSTS